MQKWFLLSCRRHIIIVLSNHLKLSRRHLQVGRALQELAARGRVARRLALQPQRPGHAPRQPARACRARQVRAPRKFALHVSCACKHAHRFKEKMHAPTWAARRGCPVRRNVNSGAESPVPARCLQD